MKSILGILSLLFAIIATITAILTNASVGIGGFAFLAGACGFLCSLQNYKERNHDN
jgi:hypothetical protein